MSIVLVEKIRPHVSLVRLNRAHRLNAMSFDLMTALYQALEQVAADNATWVVVLTGEEHTQVIVKDPAAPTAPDAPRRYRREEFCRVWLERGGVCYVLFPL